MKIFILCALLFAVCATQAAAQTQTHTSNLSWVLGAVNPNGDNAPTSIKVERKVGAGSFVQIGTAAGNATTYQDVIAGDTGGISYCYRLRASNAVGDSPYSNEACGTSAIIPKAPNAPSGLKVSAVSASEIKLSWQNNAPEADAQKVHVQATQGPGSGRQEWIALDRLASTYTDRAVTRNTSYSYKVEAYSVSGGSFSNEVRTKTPNR